MFFIVVIVVKIVVVFVAVLIHVVLARVRGFACLPAMGQANPMSSNAVQRSERPTPGASRCTQPEVFTHDVAGRGPAA